ncbi:MAG: hypothetical protein SW019_12150 [Actinomycetota bacterium]|nr:hypothetical protein [Actinomycetota bacterium]
MNALDTIRPDPGGRHIFVDAVARYAAQTRDGRVAAVERRLRAPLRLAVTGRPGVGRALVAAALQGPEFVTVADRQPADLRVLVVVESLKPEERELLRSSPVPTVVVLNKADLAGADPGGPLAGAHRTAVRLSASTGAAVVPMIALLARVQLTDDDVAALRVLVSEPADMTCTDAFVSAKHRLPAAQRARLLATLDRFGLAHALLAVAAGAQVPAVVRELRELSQTDRVCEQLAAAAAPVRYRRACEAVGELGVLAARTGDDALAAFLAGDEVVLGLMSAAVDVVQACGVRVDPGDSPEAHLRRAVHWRRYAGGPVSPIHHRCAGDITRGSLRLLSRSR